MHQAIIYQPAFGNYPINADEQAGLGCYVNVLEKLKAIGDDLYGNFVISCSIYFAFH